MSFADSYLQKHAIRDLFIEDLPDDTLKNIIAIPAYNESGLIKCLDSLYNCEAAASSTEVIIHINSGESSPEEVLRINRESFLSAREWAKTHVRKDMRFHIIKSEGLPKKHFGAGLARKLVMDEAVRRFNMLNRPDGLILSMDADTTVEKNYLKEVSAFFDRQTDAEGCSINFSHPKEGDEFPTEVYTAARNYEMHLRYYLSALRSTGYPYAFHTIGSCFAVKAFAYCKQGGMSKRQAGEDFYFIQKVAMQGHYYECNSTTVYPSPRPSDRVPFGTGPDIARQLKSGMQPYLTYHPEPFMHLRDFYNHIPDFFDEPDPTEIIKYFHPLLKTYLQESNFTKTLQEIKTNVASLPAFRKRFFQKFNMFSILRYLHFAEQNGFPRMETALASDILFPGKEGVV